MTRWIYMWGDRPIEGLFHFFVLAALLLQFMDEYQFTNSLAHLSWVLALLYGAQIEGLSVL